MMRAAMKALHSLSLVLLTGVTVGHAQTNTAGRPLLLRECIELALAHNLEIRIERLQPTIAGWGVEARRAAFDPSVSAALSYDDTQSPPDSRTRQWSPSLGLGGTLPTGTEYSLSASDSATRGTGADSFTYTGNLGLSLSQPLLRNFGVDANTAGIRIAQRGKAIAVQNFTGRVMDIVSSVGKAYYELVFAIENHKAKVEDLSRAQRLLDENRKRVEVGVMSPLDVTQAEAGVAEREEAVIVAERAIRDRENTLKRLVLADVREWQGAALQPTELPVAQAAATDVVDSTRLALTRRPEFLAAKEEIERRNIQVRYERNQLWPAVDLQGSAGLNGSSGGGFGALTDDQLRGHNPAWGLGVVVSFPLGNRQARANYRSAKLSAEEAVLNLKQLEQNIVVEVDNAVGRVATNWKRIEATRAARRLAEESFKAEESKLKAGTSTSFLVLQAQSQLAAARSAEIRARADYDQSLIDLARAEGTTLEKNQITLEEKW
jgi:outer membrane protein TolC